MTLHVQLYVLFIHFPAIREEIKEIEDGKYDKHNNVFKVNTKLSKEISQLMSNW